MVMSNQEVTMFLDSIISAAGALKGHTAAILDSPYWKGIRDIDTDLWQWLDDLESEL